MFDSYGLEWDDQNSPAKIEREYIRAGGFITVEGLKYGMGLFHHYRTLQSLLWPEDSHNRWSDLMLREILANRIVAVVGARDAGKTYTISKYSLTDYFCFPNDTMILMTSTDLRGLQLRVWGTIKDLLSRAKEGHPWLPGNVVESLHGVFTDKISDDTPVRDLRRGIIGIPIMDRKGSWSGGLQKFCFPSGTIVDTPTGGIPIENLRVGDSVFSAIGISKVSGTITRTADRMVRLHLSSGEHIDCTPNHRFLTEVGWKDSIDILPQTTLISPHESVQILREGIHSKIENQQVLLQCLQGKGSSEALLQVSGGIHSERPEKHFLFETLRGEMDAHPAGYCASNDRREGFGSHRQEHQQGASIESFLFGRPQEMDGIEWRKNQEDAQARLSICGHIQDSTSRIDNGWLVPGSATQLQDSDWSISKTWARPSVLLGLRLAGRKVGRGTGWLLPQSPRTAEEGFSSEQVFGRKRVVRVEVLEPTGDKRFNKSSGGYRVHNIEVEGHPSYSVNGCLVHNCGIKQKRRRLLGDETQFAHAEYLTVLGNLDKGDFKGVFVGNALANMKALDKISEPVEGWANHSDPTKTEVFKNRYGGVTITLVGTDSPNFDVPAGQKEPFPYLVSRADEKSVAERYGRNSEQYYSQIAGYRKPGLFAHRVLTQEMCERCHAFDKVIWDGSETTKVYAIDMGFGGDRCVAGWGEFGKDVSGGIVFRVNPPSIIPISVDTEPEDQIALYVRKDCEALKIPGSQVYFDAGMKATAATAMAKLFSPEVNAVNFGGSPTKRPVSADEYVVDRNTGTRRLKLCDEHYIKFVTELWFSVRLTVLSKQMRELPKDVAEEFYLREWTLEKGNRYELETKDDTKERTGVSPDLGDWLAILIEGARRLGFMIENLPEFQGQTNENEDYLTIALTNYRAEIKKRTLSYA